MEVEEVCVWGGGGAGGEREGAYGVRTMLIMFSATRSLTEPPGSRN